MTYNTPPCLRTPLEAQAVAGALGTAHMSCYKAFSEVFEADLDDYWIDNADGLNIQKFTEELVKPAEKRSLIRAVRERFGERGERLYKRLLPLRYGKKLVVKKPRVTEGACGG